MSGRDAPVAGLFPYGRPQAANLCLAETSEKLRFKSIPVNLPAGEMIKQLQTKGFKLIKTQYYPEFKRYETQLTGTLWRYPNAKVTVMYKNSNEPSFSIIPSFPADAFQSELEKRKNFFQALTAKYGKAYTTDNVEYTLIFQDGIVGFSTRYSTGTLYYKGKEAADKFRARIAARMQKIRQQDADL